MAFRPMAAGVRFGCALESAVPPRAHSSQTDLGGRHSAALKVYPADVQMIWPVARHGRPRQRHIPDTLSTPAEDVLAHVKWQTVS
jgi:hypothetical protein